MKKKGKISAKTAKAFKQLNSIPDKQFKFFFKLLLLAKECGIDVYAKTAKRGKGKVKP